MSRLPLLCLFAVGAIGMSTGCGQSNASGFYYDFIHVDLNIRKNGEMHVTETEKMVFTSGAFHFARRWIPLDDGVSIERANVSEAGQVYASNPAVPDWIATRKRTGKAPGGNARAFSALRENGKYYIRWWYPESKNTSRTFTIRYVVRGAVKRIPGRQTLEWKAIFKHRTVPLQDGKITVHIPWKVDERQLNISSIGAQSTHALEDGRTLAFTASNFPTNTGLAIKVRYPEMP